MPKQAKDAARLLAVGAATLGLVAAPARAGEQLPGGTPGAEARGLIGGVTSVVTGTLDGALVSVSTATGGTATLPSTGQITGSLTDTVDGTLAVVTTTTDAVVAPASASAPQVSLAVPGSSASVATRRSRSRSGTPEGPHARRSSTSRSTTSTPARSLRRARRSSVGWPRARPSSTPALARRPDDRQLLGLGDRLGVRHAGPGLAPRPAGGEHRDRSGRHSRANARPGSGPGGGGDTGAGGSGGSGAGGASGGGAATGTPRPGRRHRGASR